MYKNNVYTKSLASCQKINTNYTNTKQAVGPGRPFIHTGCSSGSVLSTGLKYLFRAKINVFVEFSVS